MLSRTFADRTEDACDWRGVTAARNRAMRKHHHRLANLNKTKKVEYRYSLGVARSVV